MRVEGETDVEYGVFVVMGLDKTVGGVYLKIVLGDFDWVESLYLIE